MVADQYIDKEKHAKKSVVRTSGGPGLVKGWDMIEWMYRCRYVTCLFHIYVYVYVYVYVCVYYCIFDLDLLIMSL